MAKFDLPLFINTSLKSILTYLAAMLFCLSTFATISKPKPVPTEPGNKPGIGLSQDAKDRTLVRNLLALLRINPEGQFEESEFSNSNIFLKLVKQERKWIKELVVYLNSAEFKSQPKVTKEKEIFEVKMY